MINKYYMYVTLILYYASFANIFILCVTIPKIHDKCYISEAVFIYRSVARVILNNSLNNVF